MRPGHFALPVTSLEDKTMKDNTAIHELARPGAKSGKITFVCFRDGRTRTFQTSVNDMTGDRLSWFDGQPPSINDSLSWIKSVFKDVRKKATKVIDCIGDF